MLGGVNSGSSVSNSVITSGPNVFASSISSNVANNSSTTAVVASTTNVLEKNLDFLFNLSLIEAKDEFDEKMCRTYLYVQNKLFNKSEQQAHEELIKLTRESQMNHDEITLGLVVSMLLEPNNAQRYYRDLIHVTRDGMNYLNHVLIQIISEKYSRLHDHSRKQLLWLMKELLRNQVPSVVNLYYNMFRNMHCGDQSPKNLWLIESILDTLVELRVGYDQNIMSLLAFALYKYLRLLVDHISSLTSGLQQKEVKFCQTLLQEHFGHFIHIGRDLVRLLQQVSRIPEFERFWKDLLTNPASLAPNFTGVGQMMKIRTQRRYTRLLVTHDMEKKLMFLTSHVHLGHQRRYQDWFYKQYLMSAESHMIRSDIIRFICCYIHPSNETIASEVIQRWAVIGWVLNTCPNVYSQAYAKLALFFDWFFFDDRDTPNNSIMDIEPGVLVIYFSLRNYPSVTTSMLDFLCRIANEFYPPFTKQIKLGIRTAFGHLCEKRVIPSLSFITDSPKIDMALRQLILKTFPDLLSEPSAFMSGQATQPPLPQSAPSPHQPFINQLSNIASNGQYFAPMSPAQTSSASVSTAFTVVLTMDPNGSPTTVNESVGYNAAQVLPSYQQQQSGSCTDDDNMPSDCMPTTALVNYSSNNNSVIYSSTSPYTISVPTLPNSSLHSNVPVVATTPIPTAATATIIVHNATPPSTNVTTISCFSDDEDDEASGNSSSCSSSSSTTASTSHKTKKLKKSNSFSGKCSGGAASVTATSTTGSTANHKGKGNSITNSGNTGATLANNPEYIANILNSTVMNNSSSNSTTGGGGGGNTPVESNSIHNSLPAQFIVENNGATVDGVNDEDSNGYQKKLSDYYTERSGLYGNTLTHDELVGQIGRFSYRSIKSLLQSFVDERKENRDKQYEYIEKIAQIVIEEDPSSSTADDSDGNDFNSNLTIILLALLDESMSARIFPYDHSNPYTSLTLPDKSELNSSITGPLFALFRALTQDEHDDYNRQPLKTLICEMGTNNSRVGFCLIYYLVVTESTGDRMAIYRDYSRMLGKDLAASLLSDLNNCAHHDLNMFFYLLPHIYTCFTTLIGNAELLSYVVAFADFSHMQFLLTHVLNDSMKIFRRESIVSTLMATLDYPPIEQNFVWQLLEAHDISTESFISILPKLDHNAHSVALFNLMQLLKREEPNQQLVKHLFNREIRTGDNFTVTVLLNWAKHKCEKLIESIGNFVSTIISSPNKRNKRTMNNVSKSQINKTATLEQILHYLDEMRKCSKNQNFFTQDYFIVVLDQLIQLCATSQKSKYSDLFSYLPDDNENNVNNSTRKGVIKKNQSKSKASTSSAINSDTESDSSEDDVPQSRSKTNTRKKRKTVAGFDSD